MPIIMHGHTTTCPANSKSKCPVNTGSCDSAGSKTDVKASSGLKRALAPGQVRLAIFPDEWFTFFYPYTGVSGPYVFGIGIVNYLISKEIYVMEHEYYTGLSIFVICYFATTRLGPSAAAALDSEIDAIANELEQSRKDELNNLEAIINEAKLAQEQAKGQKLLMDAKKENVAMQLEADYRERLVKVYSAVKGRLEYQVKRQRVLNRIHQKWMLQWILENVQKAITPEFEKKALERAIADLATISARS
ncbi:unnamed protein product [Leptidea sinapis]|uniref:ATP synthase subunit b n=1 Tax=Leptidea sinapis TaxID=189913 RepID=A0A5E4QU02_9NEOP|nr:unnamed protein product [Leptidea sinapis]